MGKPIDIPIELIEERYTISESGVVTNIENGYISRSYVRKAGYVSTRFTIGGYNKLLSLHRVVATKYVPNPHSKPEVNHKDGNKSNNHYSNLEWVTKKENICHARDVLGADFGKGTRKPLRNEMIIHLLEKFSTTEVSEVFGISQPRVSQLAKKD